MASSRLLRYRAGDGARRLLRERGLVPETVGAFVGPASGPKWLVLAGLDRALLGLGLLAGHDGRRTLLVGSSAGGWRILTLASSNPVALHQGLQVGYIHQIFTDHDTAETVSGAYRDLFIELFSDTEIDHILNHPRLDVALHVVRRRLGRSRSKRSQIAALAAGAALATVSKRGTELAFEPFVVHSRPDSAPEPLRKRTLTLNRDNFFDAAMATGSVPIYMDPVSDLAGGPAGLYLDGGLTDYHLRRRWVEDERLVLFPHYRERIAPGWFDKHLPWRRPGRRVLDNVLQIFPSREFLDRLPDGRLPDRQDFTLFSDDPQERIRRWNTAVAVAAELGEALRRDLERGDLVDRLESF